VSGIRLVSITFSVIAAKPSTELDDQTVPWLFGEETPRTRRPHSPLCGQALPGQQSARMLKRLSPWVRNGIPAHRDVDVQPVPAILKICHVSGSNFLDKRPVIPMALRNVREGFRQWTRGEILYEFMSLLFSSSDGHGGRRLTQEPGVTRSW